MTFHADLELLLIYWDIFSPLPTRSLISIICKPRQNLPIKVVLWLHSDPSLWYEWRGYTNLDSEFPTDTIARFNLIGFSLPRSKIYGVFLVSTWIKSGIPGANRTVQALYISSPSESPTTESWAGSINEIWWWKILRPTPLMTVRSSIRRNTICHFPGMVISVFLICVAEFFSSFHPDPFPSTTAQQWLKAMASFVMVLIYSSSGDKSPIPFPQTHHDRHQ